MSPVHVGDNEKPLYIGSDLVASRIQTSKVPNTKTVTSLSLSLDGKYLAIGDATGRVTLRDMQSDGKRFPIVFNAGKNVGITAMVWLRTTSQYYTIFVASGNGYLNCITFSTDIANNLPRNTGIKAPGLISCLAVNDDGSQIAVSYDYTTKVFALPFDKGDPITLGKSEGRLINQDYPGEKWHLTPVCEHPRAVSLHYVDKYALMVAFFGKIETYDTNPASRIRDKLWSIVVPNGTYIGSCALSPSRKMMATTNLHSGLDWYSIQTRSFMSETKIQDIYDEKSQILPTAFLLENTVAAGHNLGKIFLASTGVVSTTPLGRKRGTPSQYLTVSRSANDILIVYACNSSVVAHTIDLSQEVASASTATSITLTTPLTVPPKPAFAKVSAHPHLHPALTRPSFDHSTPIVAHNASTISQYTQFETPAETPGLPPQLLTNTPPLVRPLNDLIQRPLEESAEPRSLIDLDDRHLGGSVDLDWPRDGGAHRHRHDKQRPVAMAGILGGGGYHIPPKRDSLDSYSSRSPSLERSPQTPQSSSPESMTTDIPDIPSPLDGKGVEQQPRSFAPHLMGHQHPQPQTTHPTFDVEDVARPSHSSNHERSRRRRSPHGRESNRQHRDGNGGGAWGQLLSEGVRTSRANPKLFFFILLSVVISVLAMRYASPAPRSQEVSTMEFHSQTRSQSQEQPYADDDNDELDEVDDHGANTDLEDGYGEACDTIILTETKVLTITRAITDIVTVTTTLTVAASPKPKRAPQARRDSRRARPSAIH